MSNLTSKNIAHVFVKCLEAHGVTHIFGVPGEENLVFMEAIRNSRITFITTRHEQAAAFMAATFGRVTGKAGVALSTLGPGATNLMTAVAYAELGGFPLMVITGQKPIKRSKQGRFQIIDVVSMMKPVTKFSETITSSENLKEKITEALNLAESPRPGAVHFELPEDIAEELCDESQSFAYNDVSDNLAPDVDIHAAVREIENARHPLIILAAQTSRQTLREEIENLFAITGIPFVTTQMGKGVMDETSPLYIGTTSLSAGDYVHQAIMHADALLVIGHDIIEKPPFVSTQEGCKVIHMNTHSAARDVVYNSTSEVVGELAHTLKEFSQNIKPNPEWDFTHFFKVRDVLQQDIQVYRESPDFPLRPERIVGDLENVLPDDGTLALDNGMYKIWISRNFKAKNSRSLLLDNAFATMGAGLPSGIALKVLYPEKKVIAVVGDGGLMMSLGDLETAVRLGVNLVVLVLDDSEYGMIRWKQKAMDLPLFGLTFGNPDFVKLAESFGATGHKVSSADDLLPRLERALSSTGVHIISCPVNYQEANTFLADVKNKASDL